MLGYIEELFYEFLDSDTAVDSSEVRKTDKNLSDYLDENLDQKDMIAIDTLCGYATYKHEKQGFINGFLCAMKLLREQKVHSGTELDMKLLEKQGGVMA